MSLLLFSRLARSSKAPLLALAVVAGASSVHAQDVAEAPYRTTPDSAANYENLLALEDLLNVDLSVASKSQEKTFEAPSSVTVFTRNDIRNLGITTLEELLNFVPGFMMSRDPEQGSGFRLSARGRGKMTSEYVLFLLDGQRLNDLYTGGATLLNRFIAVENIKQVEIIRGPGSALYGSNAFLGVVNIVTVKNENDVTLRASPDGVLAAMNASRKVGPVEVDAFARAFSDEGYQYQGVTDLFGRQGATRDPRRGVDASLGVRWGELHVKARYMQRVLEDWLAFGALQNNSSTERTEQASISLRYAHAFNEKMRVNAFAGYSADRWRSVSLQIPAGTELAPEFTLAEAMYAGPRLRSMNLGGAVDFSWDVIETNQLLAGVSYDFFRNLESTGQFSHAIGTFEYLGDITDFSGPLGFNQITNRSVLGIYAQDRQQLFDFISLTAGVRVDVYSDFGTSVNPRAAAVIKTPFNSYVKALYGKAFRAPSFLELYDRNNPVDFGNPNLRAEDLQTFELAYVQNLSFASATLTAFRHTLTNQIDYGEPVDDPQNPLGARGFINSAEPQITQGLELEVSASPIEGMLLRATYSRLFGDLSLVPVPANMASLIASYRFGPAVVNVSGVWRDAIAILPDQPGYLLLNAAVTYDVTESFHVQATVSNLADTVVQTPTITLPGVGAPNPGRNIRLGIVYDF